MIMVQSTFQLLPDSREEALQLMKNMVRLCRQEHGCLSYEYFEGVTETNQVILLQEWEDADCLQEHYQTDHMEDFIGKLGNFLESPIITRSYMSQKDGHISTQTSDETAKPEQTIH
jgi:quinol monooxygenase YgiN